MLAASGWGAGIDAMRPLRTPWHAQMRAVSFRFSGFRRQRRSRRGVGIPEYARITGRHRGNGLDGADVICHSFGGRVTISLARGSDLFRRLVLVDAAGIRPKRTLSGISELTPINWASGLRNIDG